ncbi:hypothetical protein Tco_0121661 [Tanacetum coccineum]
MCRDEMCVIDLLMTRWVDDDFILIECCEESSDDDNDDDDVEKDEEDGEEEEHLAPANPPTVPTDDPIPSS